MNLNKTRERQLFFMFLPSLIGILLFFVVPFLISFYFALIDNTANKNFVGLQNFIMIFKNGAFQMAAKNTITFMILAIGINMALSLLFASIIAKNDLLKAILFIVFLLPLVLPSGSVIFFWKSIFDYNGLINKMFFADKPIDLLNSEFAMVAVIIIYTWKTLGYNIVLYVSGILFIPKEYYEIAELEGAKRYQIFTRVTLIYLSNTHFVILIMSIMNSFKVFKEIYLLSGNYPAKSIYMLQHFLYNQFSKADYQSLASSSYVFFISFVVINLLIYSIQRKQYQNLY